MDGEILGGSIPIQVRLVKEYLSSLTPSSAGSEMLNTVAAMSRSTSRSSPRPDHLSIISVNSTSIIDSGSSCLCSLPNSRA